MIGQQPAGLVLKILSQQMGQCYRAGVYPNWSASHVVPDLTRQDWLTLCLYNLIQTHGGQPSPAQPHSPTPEQTAGRHNKHGRSQCEGLCVCEGEGSGRGHQLPRGERQRERERSLYTPDPAQLRPAPHLSSPSQYGGGEIFILQLSIWIFDCNICIEEKWSWSAFCSARHSLFLVIIS